MKKIKNFIDMIKNYIDIIKNFFYDLRLQDRKEMILVITNIFIIPINLLSYIYIGNVLCVYVFFLSLLYFYSSFKYFRSKNSKQKYLFTVLYYKVLIYCVLSLILILTLHNKIGDSNFITLYVITCVFVYYILIGNWNYQNYLLGENRNAAISFLEKISESLTFLKKFYYAAEIFFIVLLYGYIFVKVIYFPNIDVKIIYILFIILYFMFALVVQDNNKTKIKLKISNIEYNNDLENMPIYIYNKDCISKNNYFKLIAVDFDDLFPENANNKNIIIKNYTCIKESSNEENTAFYFCLPRTCSERAICFNIIQKYETKDLELIIRKFRFYIEIKDYSAELVPVTNGIIFNIVYLKNKAKYTRKHVKKYKVDFKFTYSTNRFISPSILKKGQLLNDKINDDRCFLKHDGPYGNGKTISDIYMIASANRIPVIISPWEENYDHDILYLIFKKIKRATNTKSHSYSREYIIFYLTLLIAGYTFLFGNEDTVSSLLMPNILFDFFVENNKEWIINPLLIYAIYVPLLLLFIVKRLIPYIIVFKKDYTKIYQEFFIEEIYKMIQMNSEICLLIEDIDRLSEEAYNNVFRTLSSINKKFQRSNRVIGILSYASDNINDDLLYDLENKICYKEINFSNERHQQKMDIISNVLLHNGVNTNGINAFLSKINDDIKQITFRDLNELIDEYFVKQNHFKVYLFYANLRDTAKKKKEKKQKLSSSPQIQNNIMVNM